jgi:hypothetical protein
MPLNDIATEQTKATEKTQAAKNQVLDYLATHPDATIRYHASDMVLNIHSDASYLSVSNAWSRLTVLFFLVNKSSKQETLIVSILNVAAVIKNVFSPQQNPKLERAFTTPKVAPRSESHSTSWATHNPQRLCERITPPQTASLAKQSNKKRSKAMDMRYH